MSYDVGLFRAPERFRSFSMDRYADALAFELDRLGVSTTEVRPPFGRPTPNASIPRYMRIAEGYVRYLHHARATSFGLNHVLDHAYGHLAYVLNPNRTVVTCHDIFAVNHWLGAIEGLPRRRLPPVLAGVSISGLRRVAAVITPSEATKDDIVRRVRIRPERVHVVPYGVDESFRPRPVGLRGRGRILVVSTGAAYKNNRAAVEVLARVAAARDDVRLLRAGPPLDPADWELARQYGVDRRIEELGQIPAADMPGVYASADVLLHPSFYEGFGWPLLEAMASGVPVVASSWRTHLEATSGAALTAAATDYGGLAAHVLAVLGTPSEASRLRAAGLRRAAEFTWVEHARRTAQVYALVNDTHRKGVQQRAGGEHDD